VIDVLKHLVINKQAFAISQFFLRGGDVLGEKFFKIGPVSRCFGIAFKVKFSMQCYRNDSFDASATREITST